MSDPIDTLAGAIARAAFSADSNIETSIAPTGDCDGPESDEPRAAPTWQDDRGEEDGA